MTGRIEIKAYYHKNIPDSIKNWVIEHERKHVEITKKWWNMFANEVNWTEREWCDECVQLAKKYVDATHSLRMIQMDIENLKFDISDHPEISRAGYQQQLNQKLQIRPARGNAYNEAGNEFYSKCVPNGKFKEDNFVIE